MFKIAAKFPGHVHYAEGPTLYGSIKNSVYKSPDAGASWVKLCQIPLPFKWKAALASNLAERLLRGGVRHVRKVGDNLIIMGYRSLYTYSLERNCCRYAGPVTGSRPFNICVRGGRLYYGEYCGNPDRKPVRVFCSPDGGTSWGPIYRFDSIRHIHGVFYDKYTGYIWVTTGDRDSESAVWVTRDDFHTVEKVLGGSQQCRVVSLVFTEKYVYFGSDTGSYTNHIYRLSRDTGIIQMLQPVESAVFYGAASGDYLFFSTVCEPSRINRTGKLSLWYSTNGDKWDILLTLRKDIWPMKYFQYGQLMFPAGEGIPGEIWLNPVGLKGLSGSVKLKLAGPAGN